MAYPAYEDHGGIAAAAGVGAIDVSYPATVNENDILFLACLHRDNTCVFSTTDELWSEVTHVTDVSYDKLTFYLFWKRATGSETGTTEITSTGLNADVHGGVIFRFSGCKTSGTPYEDATGAGVESDTVADISAIDTTDDEELCCSFIGIWDDTGTSGGTNYSEIVDIGTGAGGDLGWALWTYQKATAGSVSGETVTLDGGTENWGSITLAVKPVSGDVSVTQSPAGSLAITGYNAIVSTSAGDWEVGAYIYYSASGVSVNQSPLGTLAITGFNPAVAGLGDPQTIDPGYGRINVQGFDPTVGAVDFEIGGITEIAIKTVLLLTK